MTIDDQITKPIYTLYVKIHKDTGLRYLGQTRRNPTEYSGSGVVWRNHLMEFGNNTHTLVLLQTCDWELLKKTGRYYSEYFKVTTSVDDYGNRIWANLIPETGGGSGIFNKNSKRTPEQREKIQKNTPRRYGVDHPAYDATMYEWIHADTCQRKLATRKEFINEMKVSPGNVSEHLKGERRCVNGWVVTQAKPYRGAKVADTKGKNHSRYDQTVYTWKNERTLETDCLTRHDFIKKNNAHSGSISDLVHGKTKAYRGWIVVR